MHDSLLLLARFSARPQGRRTTLVLPSAHSSLAVGVSRLAAAAPRAHSSLAVGVSRLAAHSSLAVVSRRPKPSHALAGVVGHALAGAVVPDRGPLSGLSLTAARGFGTRIGRIGSRLWGASRSRRFQPSGSLLWGVAIVGLGMVGGLAVERANREVFDPKRGRG